MKIATLKVSVVFTEAGYDPAYEDFDMEAVKDGPGQALLVYNERRWELLTPEEVVDAQGRERNSHGTLPDTGLADAVIWAQEQLQRDGYEVAFKSTPAT
jgi:hypothetical protein